MKRDKALFALLTVLVVIGALWVMRTAIPGLRSAFVDLAQKKASEALGTKVEIGSIRITGWAGVEVTNLVIMDPLSGGEKFFSSPRIHVRMKPFKMVQGKIEFGLISIDEPEIRIAKVDGRWNAKSFGKPRKDEGEQGVKEEKKRKPFSMVIRELVLRGSKTRVIGLTKEPFETRMDFKGALEFGQGAVRIGMQEGILHTTFVSFEDFLFEGDLTIRGKQLSLDDFTFTKGDSKVEGDGEILFEGSPTCHFDLVSEHFDFQHIPPGVGTRDYLRGYAKLRAKLDGKLLDPKVDAVVEESSGDFRGYGFDSLSAGVYYSQGYLEVRDLTSGFCGGRLSGDFSFDFTKSPAAYSTTAHLTDFDMTGLPYTLPPALASRIQGDVFFEGEGFGKKDFRASAVVSLTGSSVGEWEMNGLDVKCSLSSWGLEIQEGLLLLPEGAVDCRGGIGVDGFSLFLDTRNMGLTQFARLFPRQDISGALDFNGNVGGGYDSWDLEGTFVLADLTIPGLSRVARLEGNGRIEGFPADPRGEAHIEAKGIEASIIPLETVRADVRLERGLYSMDQMYVGIDSTEFLEFSLEVREEEGGHSFTLRDLLVFHGGNTSSSPGALVLRERDGTWLLEESSLAFAGGTITARGEFASGKDLLLELTMAEIDLYQASQFLRLEHTLEGKFSSELSASGSLEEPRMSMSLLALDVYLEGALVDSVWASASYANRILFIDSFRIWKGELETEGSLNLPLDLALAARETRLDSSGKFFGEMSIDLPLNLVNLVQKDFRASGGSCRADLSLSGMAGEPRWSGSGEITGGSGLYIPTNSYFDSMDAAFHLRSDSLVVESLRAASDQGEIRGTGVLLLKGFRLEHFQFALHLEDYEIHQVKYVPDLTLEGDLVLEGAPREPLLRGFLELKNGEISIPFGGERREGARDRVITFPIALSVTLDSGENMWFRNKQANVEMDFSLSLRDGPGGVRVSGQIVTERGYYLFNGRKFDIEEGSVRFAGSTVINPILDVNASRIVRGRIQPDPQSPPESVENEMRLHVSGYYDEVEFEIEILDATGAVLPVSREEAFTLLLLDMTKEEYDQQFTYYRERVGNQVMNFMGHQAASLLQDASPLDVITVDTELFAAGGMESAKVSVGKYFARRFFLSYSQDIIDPSINNIAVEYGLRKRMFIVGQTNSRGNEYSIDFKYRFKY
jgi:hypothetical protein